MFYKIFYDYFLCIDFIHACDDNWFFLGHLHEQGRRQVLEDAGVLHQGLNHKVPQVKNV